MVIDAPLLDRLKPIAPDILSIDADAVAQVAKRRSVFAGLDKHPAAVAMAGERRAMVATAMRATIAPRHGWELIEDNLFSGAYEWLADDLIVKLSKTTPESREQAPKALLGVQESLLPDRPLAKAPRETVLIRLMGNPLEGASVDIVPVGPNGTTGLPVSLTAIAAAKTDRIPNTGKPAKPSVTLPGVRRASGLE